ncbi:MAG: protein kinase [Anaerolineae bacterium]|nr:protein kinase [Anaerolineae bacterium]
MPDTAESAPLIGQTLGNYQIVEQIGQGGMATVYKAFQFTIDRYVAIKVLPGQFARDPNFVKRFEYEAKAIATLEHPHILPVHDFGADGSLYYMVMRYVEGGTLSDMMGRPLPYERIVQYVGDIARALDYAHRQGVVHRDIKPSNMLIDQHGEILLTDFGIAKIVEGANATQLTATGNIIGTPAYMAPEQAQGAKVDGRSDIYSLGVVLYELLTGQPPYQAETPFAIALKHISEPLPPPRKIKADIPEAFEQIVLKAMAKEPDHRFDTAAQMADALHAALKAGANPSSGPLPFVSPMVNEEATQLGRLPQRTHSSTQLVASPSSTPASTPAQTGGNRQLMIVGGILVLLCLVAVGVGVWFLAGDDDDETASRLPPLAAETVEAAGEDEPPTVEAAGEDEPPTVEAKPTEADDGVDDLHEDDAIMVEDDFEDGDDSLWPQESLRDEFGIAKTKIEDGVYDIQVISYSEEGNSGWAELYDETFDDFVLTVDVFPPDEDIDFEYGVFFRASDDGVYYFTMGLDAFYVTAATDDDDIELIDPTPLDVLADRDPYELTVEADGPNLSFFVDGDLVAAVEDDHFEAGALGFFLDVLEEGDAEMELDNLLIELP